METAKQTKRRLVQEAIQSNIEAAHDIRAKAPARPKRIKRRLVQEPIHTNIETAPSIRTNPDAGNQDRPVSDKVRSRPKAVFRLSILGYLVIAGFAYLSLPTHVVSTGTAASPHALKAEPSHALSIAAPQPDLGAPPPHPINREVFPLSIRKIIIDPGHGGTQTGAISESGVSEKEITLDIGLRLRRLMEQASFEVLMTRETDRTMPLDKRVAFANATGADIFISIHVNWMEPRRIRPLETYFVGPTDDPAAIRLAGLENRESGYSLADYRQLFEKVFIHMRRDESRRLAETIHTELYFSLREINPELDNRGVKTAPFIVLVGTQMPAILVEVSCLSNEDEVKLLTSSDYREKIASALSRGIRSYAETLNRPEKKGS